ncbi:MAG TPA: hypothetical protein VD967_00715 [Candidatus Paceibacterota bacterium]|nr:hypothetical protein [Candidatus Paceibacterota bacterium]
MDETITRGHFGLVARGWPFEGMFDENGGLTSSVYGQDVYRLNEGPVDLVHRTADEEIPVTFADRIIDADHLAGKRVRDDAEHWLSRHDPRRKR